MSPTKMRKRYSPQNEKPRRDGLTLFEVLISLLIFVSAMAVVGHLVDNALRASVRSRFQTEATLRCRSLMSQIITGERKLTAVRDSRFEDDPRWSWSLLVEDTSSEGLVRTQVVVRRTADRQIGNLSYELTRFVREPPEKVAPSRQIQTQRQTGFAIQ